MTLVRERPVAIGAPVRGYDILVVPEIVDGQIIYVSRHPELPRCFSQGATPAEAIADLAEVREAYLADMLAAGEPVPPPKDEPSVAVLELARTELDQGPPEISWHVKTYPLPKPE